MNETISICALSQSSDSQRQKVRGRRIANHRRSPRGTYRGFFHHEYEGGLGHDPSHRNTTTRRTTFKVAKSQSCRTTAWMSARGTKRTCSMRRRMSASNLAATSYRAGFFTVDDEEVPRVGGREGGGPTQKEPRARARGCKRRRWFCLGGNHNTSKS
jgi:hypothetical protein